MSGLTRQQAVVAVGMGWDQASLNACHCFAMQETAFPITEILPWAIIFDGRFLAYRCMSLAALRRVRADMHSDEEVICYADGSGTTQEKPSGIGVVVYEKGYEPQLIAENIGEGTNNRAELAAIWRALKAIPDTKRRIVIRSDSEYAAGVLTKNWTLKSNVGLISVMRDDLALRDGNVRIEYVAGHAGIEGNELADQLAKMGRKTVTTVSPLW